jgi:hypothetical protein
VPHADDRLRDGVRLRCGHCTGSWAPRAGSFLEELQLPLALCGWLLRAFEAGLTVTQASQEHGVHRNTVSRLWRRLRERCQLFIAAHPIFFPPWEIVEVDELYLPPLQLGVDEYGEQPPPVWVIGMVGRATGWVALEIARNHKTATIRPLIEAHLPHEQTRCITHADVSYGFLEERHPYFVARKRKAGGALWVETYSGICLPYSPIPVHSNTIEGYWSQFRRRLHDSHGWSAHYLPLILAESMFRSLRIPLTAALRPL